MKKPKVKAEIISCRLTPENRPLKGILQREAKRRGLSINAMMNNLLANALQEYTSNDPF